jgi:RimJ/RimL family protein N-acetyltransferase
VAELRPGAPEDAQALARLFLESASAGFGELLPEDYAWPTAAEVEERTRAAMGEEGVGLIVAEGPDGLLGYVGHSPTRDAGEPAWVGEVRSMFVHPSAWGEGLGHALIERAFEALRSRGFGEATLWSFADNRRANAFYERHGMARDGAGRREAVWNDVDEVRYRRAL